MTARIVLVLPPLLLAALSLILQSDPVGNSWLSSSPTHPLGTDELGRDILAIAVLSTAASLWKGAALTLVAFTLAGLVAYLATLRGAAIVRSSLRALANVIESIPILLWVLVPVIALKEPRALIVVVAFSLAALPALSTILAGELERLARSPFVEAARMLGVSEGRILARYIVPNAAPVVAPLAIQVLGAAIAIDGAFGVLGMGNRSERDLGIMLLRGKENFATQPQLLVVAILMFVAIYTWLELSRSRLGRKTRTAP